MIPVPLLAQTWLVVIGGLGGEPRYTAAFDEHARRLLAAAGERLAIPATHLVYRSESTTPAVSKGVVRAVLEDVAARAEPDATVIVLLLGHGSAVGGEARFHLPGPDLTAEEFAGLLAPFATQEVVVINAASASGPWIEALAGPRRTVITATRSAVERDETVFPRYFVAALASDTSDADRNGRTSVLEAFTFARREVERHYEEARRLRTEHALLDDDGDGQGSRDPDPAAGGDGARAAALYFDAGAAATGDPVLADLLARRDSLERALASLRAARESLGEAEYSTRLERLLLELARVAREIRAKQEGTDS